MTTIGIEGWVDFINEFLDRPFPSEDYRTDDESGGPNYFRLVLSSSRDFWEDSSDEVVVPALGAIVAELDALATVVTARRGTAEKFNARPHVNSRFSSTCDPLPISLLHSTVGDINLWRLPETGRWLTLAISWEDKELPFELEALIGRIEDLTALSKP